MYSTYVILSSSITKASWDEIYIFLSFSLLMKNIINCIFYTTVWNASSLSCCFNGQRFLFEMFCLFVCFHEISLFYLYWFIFGEINHFSNILKQFSNFSCCLLEFISTAEIVASLVVGCLFSPSTSLSVIIRTQRIEKI